MRRVIRARAERGAAAVEFALVVPVLFLILFGIIDYGLWFADGLSVRDGTRSAARAGSLQHWGDSTCDRLSIPDFSATPVSTDILHLACSAAAQMSPISGQLYLRIRILDGAGNPTENWTFGNTLRICAIEVHTALLPLIPMPNGGVQHVSAQMPIENAPSQDGLQLEITGSDGPLPSGQDWSWC